YPLLADAGLYHNGGTFSNVVISGNLSGGAITKINWLISDHLGTPRMIVDQTGALANVKRHDYLPFGEELFGGTGGRNPGQGYSIPDGVRLQFTSKERDVETGLDYFGARYLTSSQGRFTSADPLYIEIGRLGDPQQLNLYVYARNNPLKFTDPAGLDVEVTGTEQEAYRKRLQQNVSFETQINSQSNKIQIVDANGSLLDKKQLKALSKTLKGAEKQLFNAITDEKHHVTIDTTRREANVDIGRFDGGGKNTIDAADLDLLDSPKNAGALTSAQAVGHETLEAYASSKGMGLRAAHNFANGFFGGLDDPIPSTLQMYGVLGAGTILRVSFELPVHGMQGVREKMTREFVTPVPISSLPPSGARSTSIQ